jgi:DUF4097 and DUF4098 domain-containing protein YvlB
MKIAPYALTVTSLLICTAAPAAARQVDVRVKVDTRAAREVAQEVTDALRGAMKSAFGPEFRRELTSAARDIAEVIEGLEHVTWNTGGRAQSSRYRATQSARETRRFTTGPNGQLDLDAVSGDITVTAGSGREIVVEIIRNARATTEAAAKAALARVRVDAEERGGRVTIKTIYPSERQSNYSVSVDYVVTAPAGTRVSTRSFSGDARVVGIGGELSISTMSGDVVVTDAPRLTSAKTASGDITLTNVGAEGLLEASTMGGDILATGVKARRVDLGSVGGSVTARSVTADDVALKSMADDVVFEGTLTPRGRYEFTTHAGDIRLVLDGRSGFSFEGQTITGDVSSDLSLKTTTVGNRRASTKTLRGSFGDGSAVITAFTFSGDVVVTKR